MSNTETNKSCKVAFVGAGYMGSEHLKAFQDVLGVELSGIYSRTASRAEKLAQQFGAKAVCSSIGELYEKTKADLVVVSVPELSVRAACFEAFKYPWTCLVEKPAGYNLADAESILDEARKLQRQAFVGLNRRHYSSTRTVLADISPQNSQRLIYVRDQEDLITARHSNQPELVLQNWMYANSIHLVDFLSFLGRGSISAVEPIIPWNPKDPRFVLAKITYDSGDIGIYEAVWNAPGPWAVTVTTQEKRWELRPLEQAAFQPFGSRKLEAVVQHEWDTQFKPGLRLQAEEAVQAVKGMPHSLPNLEDAMKSMRLVQLIYGEALNNG